MTDARHPERWLVDRRIQRLSADDYRAYSMSLIWAVSNRTDGHLSPEDLPAIPHFTVNQAQSLVDSGLWTKDDDGWSIEEYLLTQTSRAQLEAAENARVKDAERKARDRARLKAASSSSPADSPADNSAEGKHSDVVQVDVRADNAGKDRDRPVTGKDLGAVASEKGEIPVEAPYPSDPTAIEWRTRIDSENISSVAQLVNVARCTPEQARKMWAAAFPESRAA